MLGIQFQMIEELALVNTMTPVLLVTPVAGIAPVPAQPVQVKLVPPALTAESTEQMTVDCQA